jgi:hypothetical protein
MAQTQRTPRSTETGGPRGSGRQPAAARTPAHIAHHVPGRLRIKVAATSGDAEDDEAFFDEARRLFARLPGVQDVRASRASRSIVVQYDPTDTRFAERLPREPSISALMHLGGREALVRSIDEAAGAVAHFAQQHHSRLAEAIVSGAEEADAQLRRFSDGYLDLKLLLPLGFAAATTLRKARREGTPMWMTLGTFAFNAFMSLHRNRIDGPTLHPGSRTDPAPPHTPRR